MARISDSNLIMIVTKLSEETINNTEKEMTEMYAMSIENIIETSSSIAEGV